MFIVWSDADADKAAAEIVSSFECEYVFFSGWVGALAGKKRK